MYRPTSEEIKQARKLANKHVKLDLQWYLGKKTRDWFTTIFYGPYIERGREYMEHSVSLHGKKAFNPRNEGMHVKNAAEYRDRLQQILVHYAKLMCLKNYESGQVNVRYRIYRKEYLLKCQPLFDEAIKYTIKNINKSLI
jgi:hypothetical protein